MKIRKKMFALMLVLILVIVIIPVQATTTYVANDGWNPNLAAARLNALGLFSGSSTGYNLDRVPTRAEAAVMFVRLLGAEKDAIGTVRSTPFTDVPDWASPYVGWMWEKKLTAGIGNNLFGSSQSATASMYGTFLLRALEYKDGVDDYDSSNPFFMMQSLGMISQSETFSVADLNTGWKSWLRNFRRGDMAVLSWRVLQCARKAGTTTLARELVNNGVFTVEAGVKAGLTSLSEVRSARTYQNASWKQGSLVLFGQYRNMPILWRVAVFENGNPVLHSSSILSLKAFDAAESGMVGSADTRDSKGNAAWAESNLREWLNSADAKVAYTTAMPSLSAVSSLLAYSDEAGFLNGFSAAEQKLIISRKTTNFLVAEDSVKAESGTEALKITDLKDTRKGLYDINIDTAYTRTTMDRVFLPDVVEHATWYAKEKTSWIKPLAASALTDMSDAERLDYAYDLYWLNTPSSATTLFEIGSRDEAGIQGLRAFRSASSAGGVCPAIILDASSIGNVAGAGTILDPFVLVP